MLRGSRVNTTPARIVAEEFIAFLKDCSQQVILVGHNTYHKVKISVMFIEHKLTAQLKKKGPTSHSLLRKLTFSSHFGSQV